MVLVEHTTYLGESYDSAQEAAYRAHVIGPELHAGEILYVVRRPRFTLGVPENVYVSDWHVVLAACPYVLDVKGSETAKFRKDKRLWRSYGPAPLVVVKLDCRYPKRPKGEPRDPSLLPTIKSYVREVIPGGLDRRNYLATPGVPDWLLAGLGLR
jgi:hypothetical protein